MGNLSKKQKASRALGGFTWFAFDVVDWLSSLDVSRMSSSEEGFFIRLLAIQWRDGYIPNDRHLIAKATSRSKRLVSKWMSKWGHLFPICESDDDHLTPNRNPHDGYLRNQKLHEIAVAVAKTDPRRHAEHNTPQDSTPEVEDIFGGGGNGGSVQLPEPKIEARPEAEKVSELKREKAPAERLANHFWIKIGKLSRYSNPETVKSWTSLAGSLLNADASNYDEVAQVVTWALDENAFWTERIVGATTKGPMEYFVEKYEDIAQRMGAEKKGLENAKGKAQKVAAAVAAPKANNPAFTNTAGTDWLARKNKMEEDGK